MNIYPNNWVERYLINNCQNVFKDHCHNEYLTKSYVETKSQFCKYLNLHIDYIKRIIKISDKY